MRKIGQMSQFLLVVLKIVFFAPRIFFHPSVEASSGSEFQWKQDELEFSLAK